MFSEPQFDDSSHIIEIRGIILGGKVRKSYQTKGDVKVQAVSKFVKSLVPADHACRSYLKLDQEYYDDGGDDDDNA